MFAEKSQEGFLVAFLMPWSSVFIKSIEAQQEEEGQLRKCSLTIKEFTARAINLKWNYSVTAKHALMVSIRKEKKTNKTYYVRNIKRTIMRSFALILWLE